MALLILGAVFIVIIIFLAEAGILVWVEKLFKIENPTYKNSLKIAIFSGVASAIAATIFTVINLGLFSNIIVTVVSFFGFHYFLNKYNFSSWKKSLGIYVVVRILVSLVVIMPIHHYVFVPFVVSGESMSPTYNSGDYLLLSRLNKSVERGDIVVFPYPKDPSKFFIERVIGLPTEKVDIQAGKVLINGQVLNESYYNGDTLPDSSLTLDQDQYFVMGDNRNASSDSRNWGPITESSIQGTIIYKVFWLSNRGLWLNF